MWDKFEDKWDVLLSLTHVTCVWPLKHKNTIKTFSNQLMRRHHQLYTPAELTWAFTSNQSKQIKFIAFGYLHPSCLWLLFLLFIICISWLSPNTSCPPETKLRVASQGASKMTDGQHQTQMSSCSNTAAVWWWWWWWTVDTEPGVQYRNVPAPDPLNKPSLFILAQRLCSPRRPAWSTAESSHWPTAWTAHRTLPPEPIK